jgi:hypothetical protein
MLTANKGSVPPFFILTFNHAPRAPCERTSARSRCSAVRAVSPGSSGTCAKMAGARTHSFDSRRRASHSTPSVTEQRPRGGPSRSRGGGRVLGCLAGPKSRSSIEVSLPPAAAGKRSPCQSVAGPATAHCAARTPCRRPGLRERARDASAPSATPRCRYMSTAEASRPSRMERLLGMYRTAPWRLRRAPAQSWHSCQRRRCARARAVPNLGSVAR